AAAEERPLRELVVRVDLRIPDGLLVRTRLGHVVRPDEPAAAAAHERPAARRAPPRVLGRAADGTRDVAHAVPANTGRRSSTAKMPRRSRRKRPAWMRPS